MPTKVLIVDDDETPRLLAASAVKAAGFEAATAADAEEAWRLLEDGSIRLVVSDWKMPGFDGLALCRRIRENAASYVYFILLTAAPPDEQNERLAYEAGVDDFLCKPVRLGELRPRLHVASRILNLTGRIQDLESILPICSYCKNVRDADSSWQSVESYIESKLGPAASHGICPSCFEKIMVPMLRENGVAPDAVERLRRSGLAPSAKAIRRK